MYSIRENLVYATRQVSPTVTVEEYYDMQYHVELSHDGATLFISTKDYLNNLYGFNGEITVKVNGTPQTVTLSNGQHSMPVGNEYAIVKTELETMRNAELIIGTPPVAPNDMELFKANLAEVTFALVMNDLM